VREMRDRTDQVVGLERAAGTTLVRKYSRGRAGFGPGVAPAEPGGGKAVPKDSVGDGQGLDPAQRSAEPGWMKPKNHYRRPRGVTGSR
jgi:hypothetical protein